MGSSGGGDPGMAPQSAGRFGSGVPIAGQGPRFGAGADGMRQQLAGLLGGGGGAPWPGNPAPPQAPPPGPVLAHPAMGGATAAQQAMPTGAPGQGGGWMGYSGTGTGDWNYATQGHGNGALTPGTYNYAGFNVAHPVGGDPSAGQVSSLSMPGTAGILARPTGPQMGVLPRPGG